MLASEYAAKLLALVAEHGDHPIAVMIQDGLTEILDLPERKDSYDDDSDCARVCEPGETPHDEDEDELEEGEEFEEPTDWGEPVKYFLIDLVV